MSPLLLLAAVVVVEADRPAADEATAQVVVDESARLEGAWKIVYAEFPGGKLRPDQHGRRYVFCGDRVTSLNTNGTTSAKFTLRVDNSVRPRRMDLVRSDKRGGSTLVGVYEVRDGKLQWYYTWDGARPTKLARLPEGLWLTLKRVDAKN